MSHSSSVSEISLSPHYFSAVNAITQPDKMVYASRYLMQKWTPDLGGDGLAILLFLRHLCFYNRQTGELRNIVRAALSDIAKGCGISVCTVRRQLQNNSALKTFVSSQEDFAVEKRRQGVLQIGNLYTVLMDDPIHPSDLPLLQSEIQKREMETSLAKPDAKSVAVEMANKLKRERRLATSQKEDLTPSQIDRALLLPTDSQIDRALCISQRPINLRVQYLDYLRLLPESKTTEQQQQESDLPETSVVVSEMNVLLERMVQLGVTRTTAKNLLKQKSTDAIRSQLETLSFRNATNPAAVLVKAIREEWVAPPEYLKAQEEKEKRGKGRKDRDAKKQQDEIKFTQDKQETEEIETYWGLLTEGEQKTIREDAERVIREDHPYLASKLGKEGHNPILEAMLEKCRRELVVKQMTEKMQPPLTLPLK